MCGDRAYMRNSRAKKLEAPSSAECTFVCCKEKAGRPDVAHLEGRLSLQSEARDGVRQLIFCVHISWWSGGRVQSNPRRLPGRSFSLPHPVRTARWWVRCRIGTQPRGRRSSARTCCRSTTQNGRQPHRRRSGPDCRLKKMMRYCVTRDCDVSWFDLVRPYRALS
jgi:hypothetical protein